MTYPMGTKFNLDLVSDEILRYLYWRRGQDNFIDLDQAQIELPFAFEPFEVALNKLNIEGFIELDVHNSLSGKITPKGIVFVRTTSFEEYAKDLQSQILKNKLKFWLPIILSVLALVVSILSLFN